MCIRRKKKDESKEKDERKKKDESKEENRSAAGFRKTGCIIILLFVILLILSIFIDCVYFPETPDAKHSIWDGIYVLLTNISAAGITIGAGTVLYGHFDFVQYVKGMLCKVMIEHEFTDYLNNPEKEKLMHKLQKHLIYHDEVTGNDTLYDFVNEEVRSLIQEPYYEKLYANFSCELVGDKIVKHIIREVVLNYQQDPTWRFDLAKGTKCYFYGKIDKDNPPYKLKRLRINGIEIKESAYRCVQTETKDEQGYGFTTKYEFVEEYDDSWIYETKEKVIHLEIEYETVVDKSDKTLGFRTNYPCKEMEVTLVYNAALLKVYPDVFCFKDRDADGCMNRDRIQMVENNNCIQIIIKDWLLPGDGIIYFIEGVDKQGGPGEKGLEENRS